MVKHIIGWDYADGFTAQDNQKNAETMKQELEKLKDLIEGIISIKVSYQPVETSNGDILLDSTFENEEALKAYTIHPEHVKVATQFVRPFVKNRRCFDFIVD